MPATVAPMMKTCVSCGQSLPETSFKLRASTGRQSGTRQAQCNRCLYVKYTRPNAEKKYQQVAAYKVRQGCMDCGFNAHPIALEFDHRSGEQKLFNIGEKVGCYPMNRIWAEIAKCDVVCANCHAIRTFTRRGRVDIEKEAG